MTGLTRIAAGIAAILLARPAGAQPTDLQTYTLFGQTKTSISSTVFVSNGNVGSNGMVVIKEGADVLAGSTVVGDRIQVRNGRFQGDAYYNELIGQTFSIFGTLHSPLTLPVLTLPPPPIVNVGGPIVDLLRGLGAVFSPGTYRRIRASGATTIILRSGTYEIGELVLRGDGTKIMGDVMPSTCVVRVRDRLQLAVSRVGGTDSNQPRGPISFEFAGTKSVDIGRSGAIVETKVTAPLAKVRLKSTRRLPATFAGRYVGLGVNVGTSAMVSLTPVLP